MLSRRLPRQKGEAPSTSEGGSTRAHTILSPAGVQLLLGVVCSVWRAFLRQAWTQVGCRLHTVDAEAVSDVRLLQQTPSIASTTPYCHHTCGYPVFPSYLWRHYSFSLLKRLQWRRSALCAERMNGLPLYTWLDVSRGPREIFEYSPFAYNQVQSISFLPSDKLLFWRLLLLERSSHACFSVVLWRCSPCSRCLSTFCGVNSFF